MSSGAGRQRNAVIAVVALAIVVAVLLILIPGRSSDGATGEGPVSGTGQGTGDEWPPVGMTSCSKVRIYGSGAGSPYTKIAEMLTDRLRAAPEKFDAEAARSDGSAFSIRKLESDNNCSLAVAQLTTTVDADQGVHQFSSESGQHAVTNLHALGPVHQDVLHVLVRNSPLNGSDQLVRTFADLCDRPVAAGADNSGTRQIADVLIRVGLGSCAPKVVADSGIANALEKLQNGDIDAAIWAGAPAATLIRSKIESGFQVQALDLSDQLPAMIKDWNTFYGGRSAFIPGAVYSLGSLDGNDYPGIRSVRTITIPNAVIARANTDPALVRRATAELYRDREAYVTALWGANPAHHTIPDALSIYESPLFCYIRLHQEAEQYYRRLFGRTPSCNGR